MDNKYIYLRDLQFLELTRGIEPVWYYEKPDGSIEVLAEKTSPRDWAIGEREKSLLSDEISGRNYVKNEPANLFCNIPEESECLGKNKDVCKHYWGTAYWILRESAWKLPRFVGEAKSKLVTDEAGVCKCSECHKTFSEEEQFKMSQLVSYLNTPHYCTEEDFSYHKEWEKILQFYDEGYLDDNEPFQLFDIEKALSLSEGVEPVVYVCKNILDEKSKRKILSTLKWENGSWKMKKSFFSKLKIK